MSIILYTPATGFPDLEAKIAYGLARVGIEAGCEPEIIPQQGFYQIDFKNYSSEKLNKAFLIIISRLLSSDRFFDLGVKAKDKTKYLATKEVIERINELLRVKQIESFFDLKKIGDFNFKKYKFCGHKEVNKFGGRTGLILLSSFHAGKPYSRDKVDDKFNLNLCEICGYLAVLGLYSYGFLIQMGMEKNKKYAIVLPLSEKELTVENLQMLLSLQKTLYNYWLSDVQPLKTFAIGLLAKVPSISDIVKDLKLHFHLSLISKDYKDDTVVEQTAFIDAIPFAEFISDSSYNTATVIRLLGSSKIPPKISSLIELTNILIYVKKFNLLKFARLYVQETSTNNFTNLLYPETTKYLLKEIGMIKSKIIENSALGSLARTLRYFVREKKYGYADDIRNARKDSTDFEETIAKMLRESRLRLEQKEKIHLPTDEEIKEIFHLANENFESTKLALVMLAFSFPSSNEEQEAKEVQDEV